MSSSAAAAAAVTVIPKRFCGLRVLLIEPDKSSLQHHAHMLIHNSYRVTTTTEASNGLSMMKSGHTYDCILIDAQIYEIDMEAFLHQVLIHQPQISIILMAASDDIYLKIPRKALQTGQVCCLLKPCNPRDICDIWKHICRNRISFEENVSNEKLNKDLEINDATAISNNIPQEDDDMFMQVSYRDLFSDDDDDDDESDQENVDEITIKEKEDKGKKPIILKRNNDKYPKTKKQKKTRVTWKGELDDKFNAALKELGEQASSREILKHMNVPGLTRFHVASHLQKYHKKQKSLEACIAALAQVQSFANITCQNSTQFNNNALNIQSSSLPRPPKFNLGGICYMFIENIRAKLQEAPSLLPAPHELTTTPINNYGDHQPTDHHSTFEVVKSPNFSGQGTETDQLIIEYDLGIDIDCLLSGSHNGNFGDVSEEQLACFGSAIEAWDVVPDCGGVGGLLNDSQEGLALPDFLSCDSGAVCPSQDLQINSESLCPVLPDSTTLCPSQDLQINSESLCPVLPDSTTLCPSQDLQINSESLCPVLPDSTTLFDVENCINQGPSFDFSVPEFPTEENASLAEIVQQLPLDGSEGGFVENELSQSDLENAMRLLNDDIDDGNLVNGECYFQSSWS